MGRAFQSLEWRTRWNLEVPSPPGIYQRAEQRHDHPTPTLADIMVAGIESSKEINNRVVLPLS